MLDFGGNLDQSMGIILAYTGRVSFFGVTLTQWIFIVIALPWAIQILQGLVKRIFPAAEFDPVSAQQDDEAAFMAEDQAAINNYLNGVDDPASAGAINRYRQRLRRKQYLNRR